MFRPALAAVALALAALALQATTALATVTTSNITSPADGTVLQVDKDSPSPTTISGTSDGTTGDNVQVVCYYGNSLSVIDASIPVQAGGSFSDSIPNTDFYNAGLYEPCVLRAIPAPVGSPPPEPPGSPSSFSGPTIRLNGFERDLISSAGPNHGTLRDFYLQNIQSQGGFDYVSTGDCGVYDSYLWDSIFTPSDNLFYCNDGTQQADGVLGHPGTGETPAVGSELRVDGANAFFAGALPSAWGGAGLNGQQLPGFPAITFSPSFDPTTGAATITESDVAVKCAPDPAVYPPTSASCTSYVPVGIRLDRTIAQGHDGQLTVVRSKWSSTDGASHHLQLELENDQSSTAHDIAYQFPWISPDFKVYNDGTLPGPPNGPGRIYVKGSLAAADGDTTHPRGVIVFAGAPKDIRFITDQTGLSTVSSFLADYDLTVPAAGSVRTAFAYGDAFTQAEVSALGDAAQPTFPRPSITINPTPTSFTGKATVTGNASDADGVYGVSVNGTAATVAPDGTWKATLPLNPGPNTLTATVTNLYGTTAQATGQATFDKLGLVGRPKAKGLFVVFRARCAAAAGTSCPGDALLTSIERLKGKRVLGVSARKRTVRTGRKRFHVKSGKTATIKVPLNKAAVKLLKRFHKLPVRVTVSAGSGASKARVSRNKVVFHLPKKHRRA